MRLQIHQHRNRIELTTKYLGRTELQTQQQEAQPPGMEQRCRDYMRTSAPQGNPLDKPGDRSSECGDCRDTPFGDPVVPEVRITTGPPRADVAK